MSHYEDPLIPFRDEMLDLLIKRGPSLDAKNELHQKNPNIAWDEFVEIYEDARKLLDEACCVAEQARTSKWSDQKSLNELKKAFPRYHDRTLKKALSHGWFVTR